MARATPFSIRSMMLLTFASAMLFALAAPFLREITASYVIGLVTQLAAGCCGIAAHQFLSAGQRREQAALAGTALAVLRLETSKGLLRITALLPAAIVLVFAYLVGNAAAYVGVEYDEPRGRGVADLLAELYVRLGLAVVLGGLFDYACEAFLPGREGASRVELCERGVVLARREFHAWRDVQKRDWDVATGRLVLSLGPEEVVAACAALDQRPQVEFLLRELPDPKRAD